MNSDNETKDGNVDPVCGMTVTKENAACSYEYKGKTYYFCAQSCKDDFTAAPDKYTRQ
jgi:P-type Cu+ transporter